MAAALARGYYLMGDRARYADNRDKFREILARSGYWQQRVREFPELLDFAEGTAAPLAA